MTSTRSATIAAVSTGIILILLAVLFILLQLVALNGASEGQGITSMGISLACQGVVILLAGIFARWLAHFLIARAEWSHNMAIISAVILAAALGGAISFLSMIVAIPVAGIK